MRPSRRIWAAAGWAFLVLVLVFLYAPLVPPAINSIGTEGDLWRNYRAILEEERLMRGVRATLTVGVLVAAITPVLAFFLVEAVRVWRTPKLVLAVVLIPLFVPGISMGLATALFFRLIGVEPSLPAIVAVQVIWALPFAFLIILTVMANFDEAYREAAYMSGANRVQTFFEVELPQIHPGLLGAAIFSLILSFNETVRTSVVKGGTDTVQTYLWSQYQQVGLSPNMFALMTVLIAGTLLLLALLAVVDWVRSER
jgi:putative spermidine/putrescine transport system permease protein/spermidine/putrescine transport system permease protein